MYFVRIYQSMHRKISNIHSAYVIQFCTVQYLHVRKLRLYNVHERDICGQRKNRISWKKKNVLIYS